MTLQPRAAAVAADAAEVTNATLHDEIKSLRADNEHLSEDVRTMKEDIKTLLHIVGADGGARGGVMGPSLWPAPAVVEDQDVAAIDTAPAAARVDETVLNKENQQPKKKSKPKDNKQPKKKNKPKKNNKPKKKQRGAQKMERIDEVTSKDEYWGGAFASSSCTRMVAGALMVLFAILTCAHGIMGGKDSNGVGEGHPTRRGTGSRLSPSTVVSERLDEAARDAPKPKNHDEGVEDGRPLTPEDNTLDEVEQETDGWRTFLRKLQEDSSLFVDPTIPTTDYVAIDESVVPSPPPTYGAYTSYYPTLSPAYVCNADPENCGCLDLYQDDYRGNISTSATGKACVMWNDTDLNNWFREVNGYNLIDSFPNYGLEENFCRNPFYDVREAWCFTGVTVGDDGGDWNWEFCSVPVCDSASPASPAVSSSMQTLTSAPTILLTYQPTTSPVSLAAAISSLCMVVADNSMCGCEVVQKSDYRGTHNIAGNGAECLRWDSEWMSFDEKVESADLVENYCRNPFDDATGPGCYTSADIFDEDGEPKMSACEIPACDASSCMPPCGEPNLSTHGCPSARQAEECCEGDVECRCGYLRDACAMSLVNGTSDFCDVFEAECVMSNSDLECYHYELMCSEHPNEHTCEKAAASCCEPVDDYSGIPESCLCDFYNFTSNTLGYESEHRPGNCSKAEEPLVDDYSALESFRDNTGCDYWYNKTGWLDTTPYCEMFGITCNEDSVVTEINLRNNNLTASGYDAFWSLVGSFKELKELDLAGNQLTGTLPLGYIRTFLKLEYIDISRNYFIGYADMAFPSSTWYANFSHNQFTNIRFFKFNAAYKTLALVDLSHNNFIQDTSYVFDNIPPNIQTLILTNNSIWGSLPDPSPLSILIQFDMADNNISGFLPNFPVSLQELDLSNQKVTNGGGLIGPITGMTNFDKLIDLTTLNLAGNQLTGDIPASTANFLKLKVLNLSSNVLSSTIPSELGRLKDVIEILDLSHNKLSGMIPSDLDAIDILDLSHNKLSGMIPSEFGKLNVVSIRLTNNAAVTHPAPLMLCFIPGFDLIDDTMLCPTERNDLKEFYDSAKGREWTEDSKWTDPHTEHCEWYGITCNDANSTVKLELPGNGLSGTLTPHLSNLSSLEVLDLSNNDIQGSIPTEIGLLSNLINLRLSYNEFTGNGTNFGTLQRLKLIHLHGNRLSGIIPKMYLDLRDIEVEEDVAKYAFISDCGQPSDFNPSLVCKECTMCCNNEGYCVPEMDTFPASTYKEAWHLVALFFGCVIGASFVLYLAFILREKYQHRNIPSTVIHAQSFTDRDEKYAMEHLGEDSVYRFFLGTSQWGWFIVAATIATQIFLLYVFVEGSKRDPSDGKVDMVYTWKCTRDQETCFDTNDLNELGWFAFIILMAAHLLKDGISGLKMIKYSAKTRLGRFVRIRLFIGGTILTLITAFTVYVSSIYNKAIATSNTEIITNSVVILFICDLDEFLYGVLMVCNRRWVKRILMSREEDDESDSEVFIRFDRLNAKLVGEVASLKEELRMLNQRVELLLEHSPGLAVTRMDKEEDEFMRFLSSDLKPVQVS